jgi:hypothetical protein
VEKVQCMQAIRRTHPDYESAQVYAILSLNETLQNIAAQLAELNASVRQPDQERRPPYSSPARMAATRRIWFLLQLTAIRLRKTDATSAQAARRGGHGSRC